MLIALVLLPTTLAGCVTTAPAPAGSAAPTVQVYAAELAARETAQAQATRDALDNAASATRAAVETQGQATAQALAAQCTVQALAQNQAQADQEATRAAQEAERAAAEIETTATAQALVLQGEVVKATATAQAVQRQQAAADFLYPLEVVFLALLSAAALIALVWLAVRGIEALIRWLEIRGRTVRNSATQPVLMYIPEGRNDGQRFALPGRTPGPVLDLQEGAKGYTVQESAAAVMREQTAELVLVAQAAGVARAAAGAPVVVGAVAPVAPVGSTHQGRLPPTPGLLAVHTLPLSAAKERGIVSPALADSIEAVWQNDDGNDVDGEV